MKLLRSMKNDSGSPPMTDLIASIHGFEMFEETEGDEYVFQRVFEIMSKLEVAWHKGVMAGTITEQVLPTPAFPALPSKPKTHAKTPAQIETAWKTFYTRKKNQFEKQGKRLTQSFEEFKANTKCFHCGKFACFGPVCPLKLSGGPPVPSGQN